MKPDDFQKCVLDWFDKNGRKDLPWQKRPTPYRVWVSEIMLQQTQVSTVIPYYLRFMEQFPDLESLASAPIDRVLHYWSGLGYYARAHNLLKTAQIIEQNGEFPSTLNDLIALPGIGRSTAGAILSIAFKKPAAILDGNVKRILIRFHVVEGWSGDTKVARELWQLSERYTPKKRVSDYSQAMMDIGATVCTRKKPSCNICPIAADCQAASGNRINELPMHRPQKRIPVRKRYLLVLRNAENFVWLENRPPIGIWGGLWSFPEFEQKQKLIDWCDSRNIEQSLMSWLPERRHTFSHFHLDYTPVLAYENDPANDVMEVNKNVWYNIKQAHQYGLPTPVSRLLEQLSAEEEKPND